MVSFPEGKRIAPSVSPILRKTDFAKTVSSVTRPPLGQLELSNFASSEAEYRVVSYWLITHRQVNNIVSLAEQLKDPSHKLPNILEIGAGTLLLSHLMAATGRAKVLAVEPYAEFVTNNVYPHSNLKAVEADAAWAAENYRGTGEIDLAVWSWPTISAEPFRYLEILAARNVLLIFSPAHGGYRKEIRFASDDSTAYHYFMDFDRLPGYHKRAMWEGPDHQDLFRSSKLRRLPDQNNRAVIYTRDAEVPSLDPNLAPSGKEYPWVQKALAGIGEIKLIDDSVVVCPKEETVYD